MVFFDIQEHWKRVLKLELKIYTFGLHISKKYSSANMENISGKEFVESEPNIGFQTFWNLDILALSSEAKT